MSKLGKLNIGRIVEARDILINNDVNPAPFKCKQEAIIFLNSIIERLTK